MSKEKVFTAHNIRLDDGSQTLPSAGITLDQHPVTLSVAGLLRTLFPEGLDGKTIIDVGCLEGGYATEFARMGMTATGIDVRESNYANCLYVKSRTNFKNLNFIKGDANDIAQYGKFDVFFINGLLYHLDRPRAFLQNVAENCGRAIIIHTHVSYDHPTPGAKTYGLSEICENEGLPGRWFSEYGDISRKDLDQLKWASWDNNRSFWIQKEFLLGLIQELGFDLVFEQFDCMNDIATGMTTGYYRDIDRIMLVGIKSNPNRSLSEGFSALQTEIKSLRSSTSWRVTTPLRLLGSAVKKRR